MTKISLIAVFWAWQVANGQFPVNNFDSYHHYYIPSTSAFVNQPTQQQNAETAAQLLGRTGELGRGDSLFFGAIFLLQIKQLQSTTSTLKQQLRDTTDKLDKIREELSTAQQDVSDLKEALKAITSPSSIGTIPASCEDLKTIGFVKSGIYSISVVHQVQNVYCDFTKSTSTDFQKLIGYVNVRSTPVYFYAQRDGNYDIVDTGIPFNKILMNEGTALDISTGEFLAPAPGKYFFAYSGLCWDGEAKIQLQIETSGSTNWLKIGDAHCTTFNTLAIQSTLQLAKGDRVRISLTLGITHDADGNNFSNYVGWLLEEDLF